MKTLIALTLLFFASNGLAQYSINPSIRTEFDNLFIAQPKQIQKKRYIEGFTDGFALLLEFTEDTLNLEDVQPQVLDKFSIELTPIDPETEEKIIDSTYDSIKHNAWFTCQSAYINNALGITSFFGLFSGVGFSIIINDSKSEGNFFEYVRRDSIYRNSLTDTASNEVHVKAKILSATLSNVPKKPGDVFYGKVTIVTDPFYQYDNKFKTGYIYKKYYIKYLFTSKLSIGSYNN